MDTVTAIEVIRKICDDQGEPLLETLQYMKYNLSQFDDQQRCAYEVLMLGFSQLLAPVEQE